MRPAHGEALILERSIAGQQVLKFPGTVRAGTVAIHAGRAVQVGHQVASFLPGLVVFVLVKAPPQELPTKAYEIGLSLGSRATN